MRKMYLNVAVMAIGSAAVIMTGCGSSKQVAGTPTLVTDQRAMQKVGLEAEKAIKLPCSGGDSNEEHLVVNGSGKSKNRTMAKDKAYNDALANLALKLGGVVSTGRDNVAVSTEAEDAEEFHGKTVNVTRTIAKEVGVAGYRTKCEEYTVDGASYNCYVTIEFGKQKIVKQLYEKLSSEKMIRADYDFDKYMKEFNADLKEYEQKNK
jgi:hypothetical protein